MAHRGRAGRRKLHLQRCKIRRTIRDRVSRGSFGRKHFVYLLDQLGPGAERFTINRRLDQRLHSLISTLNSWKLEGTSRGGTLESFPGKRHSKDIVVRTIPYLSSRQHTPEQSGIKVVYNLYCKWIVVIY